MKVKEEVSDIDLLVKLARQRLRELGMDDSDLNVYKILPRIRREIRQGSGYGKRPRRDEGIK